MLSYLKKTAPLKVVLPAWAIYDQMLSATCRRQFKV